MNKQALYTERQQKNANSNDLRRVLSAKTKFQIKNQYSLQNQMHKLSESQKIVIGKGFSHRIKQGLTLNQDQRSPIKSQSHKLSHYLQIKQFSPQKSNPKLYEQIRQINQQKQYKNDGKNVKNVKNYLKKSTSINKAIMLNLLKSKNLKILEKQKTQSLDPYQISKRNQIFNKSTKNMIKIFNGKECMQKKIFEIFEEIKRKKQQNQICFENEEQSILKALIKE